jgi:hypothetical protein
MAEDEDFMELGGMIQLTGFSKVEKSELVVVKKVVGGYARRFSERFKDFKGLHLIMKEVHRREKGGIFEISAKLSFGPKHVSCREEDRNMYFCIDKVLKNVEALAGKD